MPRPSSRNISLSWTRAVTSSSRCLCCKWRRPSRVARRGGDARFRGQLADVLRDAHRAELRAAHRAELGRFEDFLRQGFVVHGAGSVRVERQLELAVPVELEAGFGKLVVTAANVLAAAGDVAGVGGD